MEVISEGVVTSVRNAQLRKAQHLIDVVFGAKMTFLTFLGDVPRPR